MKKQYPNLYIIFVGKANFGKQSVIRSFIKPPLGTLIKLNPKLLWY